MSKRNPYKIKQYGVRQNKIGKTEIWGYILDPQTSKEEEYGEYYLFWGRPDGALQFKPAESRERTNWWKASLMRRRRSEKSRHYAFLSDPHKEIPRKNKIKLLKDFREFLTYYKLRTQVKTNDY